MAADFTLYNASPLATRLDSFILFSANDFMSNEYLFVVLICALTIYSLVRIVTKDFRIRNRQMSAHIDATAALPDNKR